MVQQAAAALLADRGFSDHYFGHEGHHNHPRSKNPHLSDVPRPPAAILDRLDPAKDQLGVRLADAQG
jgi:hypothetical protein